MRRAVLALMAALPLAIVACNGTKGEDEDDGGGDEDDGDDSGTTGGDEGGDEGSGSGGGEGGCPDEVPEQYRTIWDCDAATCDGAMLYRYGVGASTSDSVEVEEQWFLFNGPGDWCMDEFTVAGDWSDLDPTTFNCSECEETYEVEWEHTGTDCGVIWGGVFFGRDGSDEAGPYDGFLMFDTHNAFGGRNEDNGMLVIGAPVLGGSYYPNVDYARGTATPTGSDDAPPEDYVYVNSGSCLGGMTAGSGPGTVTREDEPARTAESLQQ